MGLTIVVVTLSWLCFVHKTKKRKTFSFCLFLSFADICNFGALTNQNLTTVELEAIGDKSNKNEIRQRNPIMKTTKINQYAKKSMR